MRSFAGRGAVLSNGNMASTDVANRQRRTSRCSPVRDRIAATPWRSPIFGLELELRIGENKRTQAV
jgi:hypothetical protein